MWKSVGSLVVLSSALALTGCGGDPPTPPKGTDTSVPDLDIDIGDIGGPEAGSEAGDETP